MQEKIINFYLNNYNCLVDRRLHKKGLGANTQHRNDSFIPQMAVQLARKDAAQKKTSDNGSIETQVNSSKGKGSRLPISIQSEMESGIGADFSDVRVHKDTSAAEMSQDLGARAFTRGNDIYFNQGEYNPESKEGKHLLAHELTHTAQQKNNNSNLIQRKLKAETERENKDLKWSFTKADASQFRFRRKGPFNITLGKKRRKPDDSFRYNVLRKIIEADDTIRLIRIEQDQLIPAYKQIIKGKVKPDLESSKALKDFRGAKGSPNGVYGIAIASEQLINNVDPNYSGPASNTDESIIYYAHEQSLIHELGHMFLFVSGVSGTHSANISESDGIKKPDGDPFKGEAINYLETFLNEKVASHPLAMAPGDYPHFSPTRKAKFEIPEKHRKDPKVTEFRGSWIEFKKEYPQVKFRLKNEGIEFCWVLPRVEPCTRAKD